MQRICARATLEERIVSLHKVTSRSRSFDSPWSSALFPHSTLMAYQTIEEGKITLENAFLSPKVVRHLMQKHVMDVPLPSRSIGFPFTEL